EGFAVWAALYAARPTGRGILGHRLAGIVRVRIGRPLATVNAVPSRCGVGQRLGTASRWRPTRGGRHRSGDRRPTERQPAIEHGTGRSTASDQSPNPVEASITLPVANAKRQVWKLAGTCRGVTAPTARSTARRVEPCALRSINLLPMPTGQLTASSSRR